MIVITCKFCSSTDTRISNGQRKVSYDGDLFEFIRCERCASYFLVPNLTEMQLENSIHLKILKQTIPLQISKKTRVDFLT